MPRDELEQFIDESIVRSRAKGYHPTTFLRMRHDWGTKEAIKRLVISGDLQSGFSRMQRLELLAWTIEAAVVKFPEKFDKGTREAAQFRLDYAQRIQTES